MSIGGCPWGMDVICQVFVLWLLLSPSPDRCKVIEASLVLPFLVLPWCPRAPLVKQMLNGGLMGARFYTLQYSNVIIQGQLGKFVPDEDKEIWSVRRTQELVCTCTCIWFQMCMGSTLCCWELGWIFQICLHYGPEHFCGRHLLAVHFSPKPLTFKYTLSNAVTTCLFCSFAHAKCFLKYSS